MDRLIAFLPTAAPDTGAAVLVHGDYRLDNCILARGSAAQIRAVLDWELSTLGDPIADFTYHLMQWRMPPAPDGAGVGSLIGHEADARDCRALEDYVALYCARTGRAGIPDLDFYLAYNFFRMAAIFQGIVGRVRDGTAANANAAADGRPGAAAGRDRLGLCQEGRRMSEPKIGLALGGGAARGLAHIPMLEVFDDLGIKPSLIAGCSIGALIGGSYASGLDARAIRGHAEAVLGKRVSAARRCLLRDKGSIFRLINFNPLAAPLIDGLQLTRLALPQAVARQNIEDTLIPFKVIATDFSDIARSR